MKKKLYLVYCLAAVSLLGIIFLQFDWMFKTWEAEYTNIHQKADVALFDALNKFHEEQRNSISQAITPLFSPIYNRVEYFHTSNQDSLRIKLIDTKQPVNQKYVTTYIGKVSISMPSPTAAGSGNDNIASTLAKADSIITNIIAKSDQPCEDLYFESDKSTIEQYVKESLVKANLIDIKDMVHLYYWRGSLPTAPKFNIVGSTPKEYRPNGFSGYDGIKKRYVAVLMHNYSEIILSRILTPVLLSLLLIIISIVSFDYLFFIIRRQKKLAEMKDDFINNMTHELKTPIATIAAAVEGMQKFNVLNDPEKTARYLETSRQELNRLDTLVTQVLQMASYEKSDVTLSIDKIEIDNFINDILNSYKIHPLKKVDISFNKHAYINFFNADPVHFRNVLANLIDNAIKYSKDTVTITIDCLLKDNFISFTVSDNGIGIPAAQLKHIFEKFHRVPTGNLHTVKGNGLGLSYVKYIMQMHGGSVTVTSKLNKGSQFIVSLPYNG